MLASINMSLINNQVDIASTAMAGSIGVTRQATSAPSATRNCAGIVCVENMGSTVSIAPTRVKTRNQVVSPEITVTCSWREFVQLRHA